MEAGVGTNGGGGELGSDGKSCGAGGCADEIAVSSESSRIGGGVDSLVGGVSTSRSVSIIGIMVVPVCPVDAVVQVFLTGERETDEGTKQSIRLRLCRFVRCWGCSQAIFFSPASIASHHKERKRGAALRQHFSNQPVEFVDSTGARMIP
jgi:hypothetical protein